MYAATVDIVFGDTVVRRLLPPVALEACHMDGFSKSVALLWAIFLLVGPEEKQVRSFCNRVVAICSDSGVEAQVVDYMDFLVPFFEYIGGKPGALLEQDYLFPIAMRAQGWRHAWDGGIQRCLTALPWFPSWLLHLKAVVYWIRDKNKNKECARLFRQQGKAGVADMLAHCKPPNFARWRWATLAKVIKALDPVLESFLAAFDPTPFKKTRDPTLLRQVTETCRGNQFLKRLTLVRFVAEWMDDGLAWVGGCPCHEPGEDCPLHMKGRRLPEAFDFAMKTLNEGLQVGNAWSPAVFANDQVLWAEAQGSVRAGYDIVKSKVEHLDCIPWLFCKLDLPGVRDRCFWQYSQAPPASHHKVSVYMLGEHSEFRGDLLAMDNTGGGMSVRLASMVRLFKMVPIDDVIAEGPHSTMGRLSAHARSASWPWQAASIRVKQNLADWRTLGKDRGIDIQGLWDGWSGIIKPATGDRRRQERKIKLPRKKVEESIYHLAHVNDLPPMGAPTEEPVAIEDEGPPDNEDHLPSDDGAEEPDDGGAEEGLPSDSSSSSSSNSSSSGSSPAGAAAASGAAGSADPPPPPPPAPAATALALREEQEAAKVVQEYLLASLEEFGYFTMKASGATEEATGLPYAPFQLVRLRTKAVLVKTWRDAEEQDVNVQVTVQPLEVWRAPRRDLRSDDALEVFPVHDPVKVSFADLCRIKVEDMKTVWQWKTAVSDVEGCITMQQPAVVTPKGTLEGKKVPVLRLLWALEEKGFLAVRRKVLHFPGSADLSLDVRGLPSRRQYFQCVLALESLWSAGLKELPSTASQAAFSWALLDPAHVDFRTPAKDIAKAVAALRGDPVRLCELEVSPQLALPPPPPLAPPSMLLPSDDEEEAQEAAPAGLPSDEEASEGVPTPPAASPEPAGEIVPALPESDSEEGEPMPEFIFGQRVTRAQRHGYSGLRVGCITHPGCRRHRNFGIFQEELGRMCTVHYLETWLAAGSRMTKEEHQSWYPKVKDIQAYLADALPEAP